MYTERNCHSCNYYKDGYCENLELKPCYPQKGCDDFENKDLGVLDKLRAEIKTMGGDIETIADVLAIIDKYKGVDEGDD